MKAEPLAPEEARVLGSLIEKSLATPDYYPLTLNALRLACNQKSSREPVTDYGDEIVLEALAGLKRKVMVAFVPFGNHKPERFKYRHFLEDPRFGLRRPDLALLAVLLLRGPQTLNELKVRAAGMHAFASLEEAEACLRRLAGGEDPVVEHLPKRPGWKEPRWRHRFFPWDEPAAPADAPAGATAQGSADVTAAPPGWREESAALRAELEELRAQVADLKVVVDRLAADLL